MIYGAAVGFQSSNLMVCDATCSGGLFFLMKLFSSLSKLGRSGVFLKLGFVLVYKRIPVHGLGPRQTPRH